MKNLILLFCFTILVGTTQARKGPLVEDPYPVPQGPTLPQPHQPIPRK